MATCAASMRAVQPRLANVVFTGISERELSASLTENSSKAVESLKSEIASIVAPLALSTSTENFKSLLAERFSSYSQLVFAVSSIVTSRTTDSTLDEFAAVAFRNLAKTFEGARPLFGASVTENVVFSVYAMQRTYKLLRSFPIDRVRGADQDDGRFLQHGLASTLVVFMFIDCLRLSLERDWQIVPEILDLIGSGIRHYSTEAYAAAREMHMNREPDASLPIALDWDEEDQELAEESYRDVRLAGD